MLTALVIGSADTLFEDEARARELFTPDILIGCNHAARDHDGPVDHWATMHPDLFKLWLPQREAKGLPPAGQLWTVRHRAIPAVLPPQPVKIIETWGGSSGLLCVAVAYELGVDKIVLAGVPMLPNNKHYDSPKRWDECRAYHRAWEQRRSLMYGRVKSMSGWTREILGSPEESWFADTVSRSPAEAAG